MEAVGMVPHCLMNDSALLRPLAFSRHWFDLMTKEKLK
jgi:hypothetical protein